MTMTCLDRQTDGIYDSDLLRQTDRQMNRQTATMFIYAQERQTNLETVCMSMTCSDRQTDSVYDNDLFRQTDRHTDGVI